MTHTKASLEILKIFPRGFCAGVDRAIQIVERALEKFGWPVFVRHDIVHNYHVVETLKAKGAIFLEEIDDIPPGFPVIFSAHGVPQCVVDSAKARQLFFIDATCPLVTKVHTQVRHFIQKGYEVILIGHKGHPEVIGTLGQAPFTTVTLIENEIQAQTFEPRAQTQGLSCVTQTTLSVDEVAGITLVLKERFPHLIFPSKEDICYATTNRQEAVKATAPLCDILFVIGSFHSSNSQRLVEVARAAGCSQTFLIDTFRDIPWSALAGKRRLGLTSGASAPESLLEEVIEHIALKFEVHITPYSLKTEDVTFNIPKILA